MAVAMSPQIPYGWCMSTESRTVDCIARRLARITAGELPRLHQHRADYILSDKSVKGEESTTAVLKEGKAKANEQKSGHSGAETIYNRCF